MRRLFGRNPRLTALIALGICNHIALSGNRVAVSLEALHMGASSAVVGLLLALYALLPMFFAVSAGRWSDRIGVRHPMLAGSIGMLVGSALPALVPGLATLFVSAVLLGVAFMLFQVPAQNATGEMGPPAERSHNFSMLALGYSISGFCGPLIAGFAIDHGGFATAFTILALMPLVPVVVLAANRLPLHRPHPRPVAAPTGGALELLRLEKLRRVFFVNVLLAAAWDLHMIVIPVYGARIGLSASAIGIILASFAGATFVVRFAMRWIVRHVTEHQVLTIALVIAGLVYLAFPLSHDAWTLTVLSFCLGLGLGMSQPMVMSLLHTHTPPGRMGEAAGVRMSLVQAMAVAVPLTFGTLGATIGLTPVFWSVGVFLAGSGILTKRAA